MARFLIWKKTSNVVANVLIAWSMSIQTVERERELEVFVFLSLADSFRTLANSFPSSVSLNRSGWPLFSTSPFSEKFTE